MKKLCAVLLAILLLVLTVSCSPTIQETDLNDEKEVSSKEDQLATIPTTTEPLGVEAIIFVENELDVVVGETVPLLFEVIPADLKDSIKWTSSDDSTAKYFGGEVLGKRKGSCIITATADNGISAECKVTVGAKVVNSGSAGEHVTWTYYDDHSLVFNGTGDMEEYYDNIWYEPFNVLIPWHSYSATAKEIIVEDGITSLANFAFLDAKACEKISIADSVSSIGYCSFQKATNIKNLIIGKNVTKIGAAAFSDCDFIIHYDGTAEEFATIIIEKPKECIGPDIDIESVTWDRRFTGKLAYYSETHEPGSWHYVDGAPTLWN